MVKLINERVVTWAVEDKLTDPTDTTAQGPRFRNRTR
jgi:hypothetical protein